MGSKSSVQSTNIYRAARLRKNITLVKASDDTHIRRSVLQAIEQGQTDHLPAVYAAGLKQSYARYLGIGPGKSAVDHPKSRKSRPATYSREKLRNRPVFTSVASLQLVIVAAIGLVLSYAGLQTYRFFTAPILTITNPIQKELLSHDSALEISGRTSPEVNVFVGQQIVPLQPDGSFQATVTLRSGINDIEVRAVNALGKVATHHLTAVFMP
jgi:cytoskeletal protein RodZ